MMQRILLLLLVCGCIKAFPSTSSSFTLQLHDDGTFKIAQFTDMHYAYDLVVDPETAAVQYIVIDNEQPDLVVLTGDAMSGTAFKHRPDKEKREWEKLTIPMREKGVPWATVFGNHDPDGALNRTQLLEIDQSFAEEGCLTQRGPEDIPGVTNYWLPVYDNVNETKIVAILWLLYVLH